MAPSPARRYLAAMDAETRTFVEEWMRDNADVLDEIVRMQAADPRTAYGAALERQMAALDTDRRPDA